MQNIWLDVTTTLQWKRPPVGILRVERELIRYHRTQGTNYRFVKFEKTTRAFVEVCYEQIEEAFQRQVADENSETSSLLQNIPKIQKKKHLSKGEKIARETDRILKKADLILNILGLKKEKIAPLPQLIGSQDIRPQETQNNQNRLPPPCCLQANDSYLSCGLDWDDKELGFLYCLKEKLSLHVTLFCYDLIPILYPHLVLLHVGSSFQEYFYNLAWCADTVCCISKNSENDFLTQCRKLGTPLPPTVVIRLGDNCFSGPSDSSKKVSELIGKKYILFVSTIEKRKNHTTILHVFARLCEKYGSAMPHLVFVGMPGWGVSDLLQDLALDHRIKNMIHWYQKLTDHELQWLYQHCLFTVFPSLYEGWGLPVAESLAMGKYCLISDSSSLREVAPKILDGIDPLDVPQWEKEITKLIFDNNALKQKELNIKNQYQIQTWNNTFNKIPVYLK